MTYDEFLTAMYRAPHNVACSMCKRLAYQYDKSVREVAADFRDKYGIYL